MFVKSIMKPSYKCIIASQKETLKATINLLESNDIEAMPVVDSGEFMGMISRQDIYKAYFQSGQPREEFLTGTTVGDISSHGDLYIDEEAVFEKTLTTFKGYPILAVVEKNKKFLGIVTRFDMIEQFESAFGVKKHGIRIAFTSEESSGRLSRLADIIKQHHANVISVTTFDETDKLARRIVLKVEKTDNIEKLSQKLEKSGFRVLDIKEV
ncbi:CBS domain-containing protein [Sediminibacillus albus]|uniref:CBS domain-containing protein n=1 Tax=Sediminibacillus albus TaxID=407036 RepID=A0A1G8VLI2_9BACI|nr:CBS domain-containing protein [Sediminibacillus albus]SDJ66936.1 CBS domain-containing protein [Sediminibacillus albus]